jgi:hypothetical protein
MLLAALAAGMFLLGCPTETKTETKDEKDTWGSVPNESNLVGTWNGPISQTKSIEDFQAGSKDMFGDIKVAMNGDITMRISAEKTTPPAVRVTMKTAFSGGDISVFDTWEMIRGGFIVKLTEIFISPDPKSNDIEHSITVTEAGVALTEDGINEMLSKVKIHQDGNQIKIPGKLLSEYMPEEITLVKQQ